MDTNLEQRPDILQLVEKDITGQKTPSNFGRCDVPNIEQIVRTAIYKELKGMDYKELEYAKKGKDMRYVLKIDELCPYCFQMYQKYISRISEQSLQQVLVGLIKLQ